jgi:hypothetical protein
MHAFRKFSVQKKDYVPIWSCSEYENQGIGGCVCMYVCMYVCICVANLIAPPIAEVALLSIFHEIG